MLSHDRARIPFPTPPASGGLSIIVIDDEQTIRGPVSLCLEAMGHRLVEASSAEEALSAAGKTQFDVALLDVRLGVANGLHVMTQLASLQPRLKIIIITAYASVEVAMRAMSRGAVDILCKPFTPDQLTAAVTHAADLSELESTIGLSPDRFGTGGAEADFATTSAMQQEAVLKARRMASSATPLLVTGEPGVGKRVLARAIHGWSMKPEGPFLGIDCAAHSAAFVDLALFGDSVFGSQVITAERPSLVKRCRGGTLLAANVESLTALSQLRLASLLTTGQFAAWDSATVRPEDVRIIATAAGDFSHDSLNAAFVEGRITLPPLRERAEDIPMIAQRYLGYLRQGGSRGLLGFSVEAIDAIAAYSWPGNLRELRKVIGEVVQVANEPYIRRSQLPGTVREFKKTPSRRPQAGEFISLADLEAAHIRAIVAATSSLQEAAAVLGLDFQALYRRRKQFGIE